MDWQWQNNSSAKKYQAIQTKPPNSTTEGRNYKDTQNRQDSPLPTQHTDDAQFMLQRLEAMALVRVHCTGPWNDDAAGATSVRHMEGCGQDVMLGLLAFCWDPSLVLQADLLSHIV